VDVRYSDFVNSVKNDKLEKVSEGRMADRLKRSDSSSIKLLNYALLLYCIAI